MSRVLRMRRVEAGALGAYYAPKGDALDGAAAATAETARLFYIGDQPVAAAGLLRIIDGRLFLFFDVTDGAMAGPAHARLIIETALEMLEEAGEPVWTPCHEDRYPRAPKLVALCGFLPTDEYIEDARVWLKLP